MTEKNFSIQHLFLQYFNKRATEDEIKKVENWIEASDQNKQEFEAYLTLWEKTKRFVVSDSVNVEDALRNTKKKIHFSFKKRKVINILRQAAAVVVIAIALSVFYNYFITERPLNTITEETIYREVKTSYGTQSNLTLADGTRVWLNSGSKLKFPVSFRVGDDRKVELVGEGFFKVAKNSEKPFIVQTSSIDVKVLGTSFNVSAYNNEPEITVALLEGSVELVKMYNGQYSKVLELSPNEVATYNKEKELISYSDINLKERYTAWMDGRIVFNNDPIEKLAFRLENWYNVDVEIKGQSLNDYRFTATFIDESLEQILKLLALSSPMEYEIEPARKLSDNSYTKRKIVFKEK
jgi:transmembrane sensor